METTGILLLAAVLSLVLQSLRAYRWHNRFVVATKVVGAGMLVGDVEYSLAHTRCYDEARWTVRMTHRDVPLEFWGDTPIEALGKLTDAIARVDAAAE